MKVVHIVEALGGGIYTYFKDLSLYINENKIDIEFYLIYSSNRKEIDRSKVESDFSKSFKLIEVSMARELSPIKDFVSTIKLYRILKTIDPNIVHLHSSKAGVVGRIANAILLKRNHVYYTPHGYAFLRQDIPKYQAKIYWIIEKINQLILGGVTIACGDTEYLEAQKIGKALLVRNGLKMDVLIPKKNIINETFTIGTVGRISEQKNPTLFNDIALKFPEINFIWVGGGDLENLLTASNIKTTGWVNRDTALEYVEEFNIYIQTSLWEGLPFTIIEAMFMSKPVIATNVIGNKDAVTNNYNGYLCNNISEFEYAINTIKEDINLERLLGRRSNELAKELFDSDTNLRKLMDIYYLGRK